MIQYARALGIALLFLPVLAFAGGIGGTADSTITCGTTTFGEPPVTVSVTGTISNPAVPVTGCLYGPGDTQTAVQAMLGMNGSSGNWQFNLGTLKPSTSYTLCVNASGDNIGTVSCPFTTPAKSPAAKKKPETVSTALPVAAQDVHQAQAPTKIGVKITQVNPLTVGIRRYVQLRGYVGAKYDPQMNLTAELDGFDDELSVPVQIVAQVYHRTNPGRDSMNVFAELDVTHTRAGHYTVRLSCNSPDVNGADVKWRAVVIRTRTTITIED
jgi:hypothetical protein